MGPRVHNRSIFDPKISIFLRYTHITPLFWARTDPTQWDHNFPTSWGNSGYPRFSGRWPFGRSAGRFMAPIAQSGLSWGLKCSFSGPAAGPWPAVQRSQHKKVVFLVSCHDGIKIFGWCLLIIEIGPKNSIFGPQKYSFGHLKPYNSQPSVRMGTYR